MIEFRKLSSKPADWDVQIQQYPMKTLFHESAWLQHVQDIHPNGQLVFYEIVSRGRRVGLYCALRVRRMLIPIDGSPLGGTGTNFMGPLVEEGIDQAEVVTALLSLAGPKHYLHLELSSPWLDREIMCRAGFQVDENVTHVCELPNKLEDAWAMLRSEARNRVRKAEKAGLVAERTDDPSVVDHFFDQFVEIYAKQGMATPWGRERPKSLYEALMPAERILPIWVHKDGEIMAAGLFPFDQHCIYFWGAGSWLRHQAYCPNELLQWSVIKFAVERGIPLYNMCGGTSQFKNKFGGSDVPYLKYHRSSLPFIRWARDWYKSGHHRLLKLRGRSVMRPARANQDNKADEPERG